MEIRSEIESDEEETSQKEASENPDPKTPKAQETPANTVDEVLAGISEIIEQLRAFGERVYEQALDLRAVIGDADKAPSLSRLVQENLDSLQDRLEKFRLIFQQLNRQPREKDQEILHELDVLCEKIFAIITLENEQRIQQSGFSLHLPLLELVKTRAKRLTDRMEQRRNARKYVDKGQKYQIGINEADGDYISKLIYDLRRTQFITELDRTKQIEEEKKRQKLKARLQVVALVLSVLMIPIAYNALGKKPKDEPTSIRIYDYREIIELTSAYELKDVFTGHVEATWKDLYPREKKMQIHNLNKKLKQLKNRNYRIEIRGPHGTLWAEFHHDSLYFY